MIVGGRPVCDDDWDANDAKVVCKNLGFGGATRAIPTSSSTFGRVPTNFRINHVQCSGTETKLYQCAYRTQHNCGSTEGTGVVCVDPTKLSLQKSGAKSYEREGNVFVNGFPVCDNNWDTRDAQVVCNGLFKQDFSGREGKVVPVFRATTRAHFGNAHTDDFILDAVSCNGDENWLTDCSFKTHDAETCNRHQAAGVQCAKCTPDDLIHIIKLVKVSPSIEGTKKSIAESLASLKTRCYEWDCSARNPVYPEYCYVLSFLQEATYIVERDSAKNAFISLRFNPGKLLEHQFTKGESDKLISRIDDLQEQGESFQKQLATYYRTIANFDRDKAKADHHYSFGVWQEGRHTIANIQSKLGKELKKLFGYAFAHQSAKLVHQAFQLAMAIAAMVCPAEAVFNPGELAAKAATIEEKAGELADATAEMAELGYTFGTTLPKFLLLSKELQFRFQENKDTYLMLTLVH